ncbi:MAG: FHA domain-containing protein, partial [Acidimicrobiales bacterium]
MQDLEIIWPDGVARFSVADSPIHLGRSSEAAVPLTEGSVSRRHLVLDWDGSTWIATDSSTHGTFDPIGVRLASRWHLATDSTIRLGGVEGVQVQIRPVPPEPGFPNIAAPADRRSARNGSADGDGQGHDSGGPAGRGPAVADVPAVPPIDHRPDGEPGFGGLFAPPDRNDNQRDNQREAPIPSTGSLFPDENQAKTPSILGDGAPVEASPSYPESPPAEAVPPPRPSVLESPSVLEPEAYEQP